MHNEELSTTRVSILSLEVDVDGSASKSNNAVEGVVGAAYGLGRARVASNSDDAKGRASNTDKTSDRADSYAEETQ